MNITTQLSAALTPNQQDIDRFALELKRVLYVSQMLSTYSEWLQMDKVTPSWLKTDIQNLRNSIRRMLADIQQTSTPEQWELIRADLDSDQLADLSELIDVCSNVKNISAITEIIKESKASCEEL